MPSRKGPSNYKGITTHRPDCRCPPCNYTLRRQAEALAVAARERGVPVAPPPSPQAPQDSKPVAPIVATGFGLDNSLRGRIADWLTLRAQEPGITNSEVAKRLGIDRRALAAIIAKARKEGVLQFDDPLEKLEFEIIPKTIENLNHFLDIKDKTVTIETAKGTIFRDYQEAKGLNQVAQTVLALKIETAPDGEQVKVVSGHVVGRPRIAEDSDAT